MQKLTKAEEKMLVRLIEHNAFHCTGRSIKFTPKFDNVPVAKLRLLILELSEKYGDVH
ncbi:hypothetical protein G6L96_025735 (plasmid) [Agrobacterium tumefaciens]|uniref:hypothetical protein n=1 Tax=Agrobacterium tumefaciens TaxID=358 RepID=UPI00157304CF|nr:hypothetical protein [Agrobacterium tumefaciens]WCK74272.1 hypothetical protein G6L96_025735 [Agrobacterium tumefaciens]